MFTYQRWSSASLAAVLAVLVMAGCASKAPQGYGVAPAQGTAALAQAQMQMAEQATQVDTSKTYLGLIEQMQQTGNWYASLAHTEAFVSLHGTSAEVQLLRADALRNTLQYEAAHQLYLSLLSTPVASRAHRGMGLLEASQGRYRQAVDALEQARKLNPIDANVLSDMGYAYMLDGQLEPARLPLMQAAQLAPDSARVQLNLAIFLFASGENEAGSRLLQKLQLPQPPSKTPLIDAMAVQQLQEQVLNIRQAIHAQAVPVPAPMTAPTSPVQASVVRVSEWSTEPVTGVAVRTPTNQEQP